MTPAHTMTQQALDQAILIELCMDFESSMLRTRTIAAQILDTHKLNLKSPEFWFWPRRVAWRCRALAHRGQLTRTRVCTQGVNVCRWSLT